MPPLSRRHWLAGALTLPLAAAGGCGGRAGRLPPAGEIVGAGHTAGHRLRERVTFDLPASAWQEVEVAIVGGGAAGLAAAWRLTHRQTTDFVVLELEPVAGGTSRSGKTGTFAYPWGAHYLPLPLAENRLLLELLDEMGVLDGYAPDGAPRGKEEFLCRDPEERLFVADRWYEGLFPESQASADDRAQWEAFKREVERWIAWRDDAGRRAFAIPIALASTAAEVRVLDAISFAAWLDERKLTSPRLRWWLEYATRDDYGSLLSQCSAWAGLFYFAARAADSNSQSQPLLTWPEGNGRLIAHLAARCQPRIQTGATVVHLERGSAHVHVGVLSAGGEPSGYRARRVIYAAPQFTLPYVWRDCPQERKDGARTFAYGSWLVANLHLSARPANEGFAPAWDNVLYESEGLGYVTATHQLGLDHGPTVWTYYRPLCHDEPTAAREELLAGSWSHWAEVVLADLETAHREIRSLVERLDVMLWGHAMIQPRVGAMFGGARERAAQPEGNIHFAHSDLSGVALFEEAFYHGCRAADEVIAARDAR